MVNARWKGKWNETKAKKELEKRGWLVEQVKGSTKFNLQCDFFGLFDIIALKQHKFVNIDRTLVLMVQVKSNVRINKQRRILLQDFKNRFKDIEVEEWVYKDRDGLYIYPYYVEGGKK